MRESAMAVQITNMDEFQQRFCELKDHADLFAYFLFDSRMSHEKVGAFANKQFDWLNSLAIAADMFLFVFIQPDRSNRGFAINPSAEVAQMFGISPNQLPGVVLFTLSEDKENVSHGVFLPINAKLFEEEVDRVEKIFADLITVIQKCRRKGHATPEGLMEEIGAEIPRLRREDAMRPIWNYFKENLAGILNLPKEILTATTTAIAESIARKAVGG